MHPSLTLQKKRFKELLRSQKDIAAGIIVTNPETGEQEYWSPGSIPAGIPEVKRFTFEDETVWTVTHNFGERPILTIWKGSAINHYGFGTQPFGSSPFGGGTFTEDGEEATHEPLIEEVSLNEFTVTWDDPTSGIVVVTCSGGMEVSATVAWDDVADKPTDFPPSEHNHDVFYAEIGHTHELEYADIDHNHDGDYSALGHGHDYLNEAEHALIDHTGIPGVGGEGGPGGSSTFTGLTDTPTNYTGQAGKYVRVNAEGNGLDFTDPPETGVIEGPLLFFLTESNSIYSEPE